MDKPTTLDTLGIDCPCNNDSNYTEHNIAVKHHYGVRKFVNSVIHKFKRDDLSKHEDLAKNWESLNVSDNVNQSSADLAPHMGHYDKDFISNTGQIDALSIEKQSNLSEFKGASNGSLHALPCNVSRHMLLAIYMMYALLTGCTYFGWPSIKAALYKSGAYRWKCDRDEETGEYINDQRQFGQPYVCDAQDAAVSPLFTVAMVCHSLMTAGAGTLLDHIGPKKTAIAGQILNGVAWLLIGYSSEEFPAYIPGMVLLGLGADTGYLPLLKIVRLYTNNSATVISMLGTACTASFGIPYALNLFYDYAAVLEYKYICLIYVLVGPVFCLLLAIFFIPWFSFDTATFSFVEKLEDMNLGSSFIPSTTVPTDRSSMVKSSCSDSDIKPCMSPHNTSNVGNYDDAFSQNSNPETKELCDEESSAYAFGELREVHRIGSNEDFIPVLDVCIPLNEGDSFESKSSVIIHMDAKPAGEVSSQDKSLFLYSNIMNAELEGGSSQYSNSQDGKYMKAYKSDSLVSPPAEASFRSQLFSYNFLCIALYSCAMQLAVSFFQSAIDRILVPEVSSRTDILISCSFIPCVIIGISIDRYGPLPILLFMNTIGILTYVLSFTNHVILVHYVAVGAFCVYISLDSEQVYCYVDKTFSCVHFGKLSGIAIAMGGLFSLAAIPLYDVVTVKYFNGSVVPVAAMISFLLFTVYIMLILQVVIKQRRSCLSVT